MKQLSSLMASMVMSSLPSQLRPPSFPSRLRPPPDPPPYSSSHVSFEAFSSPEPPDPPDVSSHLVIHLLFDTPFTLFQAFTQTPNLKSCFSNLGSDGVVSFVFIGDTDFSSKWFYYAVCSVIFSRHVNWSRHCSSPIHARWFTLPVILVRFLSSTSICYLVEWHERFVGCVAPDLLIMNLDCNVPMNFVSFGSTKPVDGSSVVLVRPFTAICSLLIVLSLTLGAGILCYPSWWQIEGKLIIMFIPVNRVMTGFHYPMSSFVEQSLFQIFPHMLSELDVQTSLVLQGSSLWLMFFSAFVAVFVTFQVTRWAIIQEAYEIFVVRILIVSCYDVYRQFIFNLINVWFVQPVVALVYSLCRVKLF